MLVINKLEDGIDLFKALGSEVRINIIKLLLQNEEMNLHELATALNLTNGAITGHIRKLEETGIINVTTVYGGRGNQKICKLNVNQLLVSISSQEKKERNTFETEIKVGEYQEFHVEGRCGLATTTQVIGLWNKPEFFRDCNHSKASVLWFSEGFVEYVLPKLPAENQKIVQITLCFEIAAEQTESSCDSITDITFKLNNTSLGTWTSPNTIVKKKGIYTPAWWSKNYNQYGLLKMIDVNDSGTFIDGLKISEVGMNDLSLEPDSELRFRFETKKNELYTGGLALYGKGFGNYNQDIMVRLHYISN